MKIYLASSFTLKSLVQAYAEVLQKEGHIITVDWWNFDYKTLDLKDEEWYNDERVQNISKRNFNGIRNADALLLVSGTEERKFNGANIELGYALAIGKPCYSVGSLERSAMYVPVKKFVLFSEFYRFINASPVR